MLFSQAEYEQRQQLLIRVVCQCMQLCSITLRSTSDAEALAAQLSDPFCLQLNQQPQQAMLAQRTPDTHRGVSKPRTRATPATPQTAGGAPAPGPLTAPGPARAGQTTLASIMRHSLTDQKFLAKFLLHMHKLLLTGVSILGVLVLELLLYSLL